MARATNATVTLGSWVLAAHAPTRYPSEESVVVITCEHCQEPIDPDDVPLDVVGYDTDAETGQMHQRCWYVYEVGFRRLVGSGPAPIWILKSTW